MVDQVERRRVAVRREGPRAEIGRDRAEVRAPADLGGGDTAADLGAISAGLVDLGAISAALVDLGAISAALGDEHVAVAQQLAQCDTLRPIWGRCGGDIGEV